MNNDCLTVVMQLADPFTAFNLSIINKSLYYQVKNLSWYKNIIYISHGHWRSDWYNDDHNSIKLRITKDFFLYLLKVYSLLRLTVNKSSKLKINFEDKDIVLSLVDKYTYNNIWKYVNEINQISFTIEVMHKAYRLKLKELLVRLVNLVAKSDLNSIPLKYFDQNQNKREYLRKCYYDQVVPDFSQEKNKLFLNLFIKESESNFYTVLDEFLRNKIDFTNYESVILKILPDRVNHYLDWLRKKGDNYQVKTIPNRKLLSEDNYYSLVKNYLRNSRLIDYDSYLQPLQLEKELERLCYLVMKGEYSLTTIYDVKLRYFLDGWLKEEIKSFNLDEDFWTAALEFDWSFLSNYVDVISTEILCQINDAYNGANDTSICSSMIRNELESRKRI